MWSNLSFENIEWFTVVVLTAILLWGIFVWKSWNGRADKRFYLNSFMGFVAVLCLSLLVLRPTYLQKVKGEAVLLTDGYQKETLDSIKRTNRKISVLDYTPGMNLSSSLDSIDRLLITGYGVRDYDLWQFKQSSVSFLPEDVSDGILQLKYDQEVMVGDELTVEGLFKNPIPQSKLILHGPGGNPLDSIVFLNKEEQGFTLKTNLKASGKFLFFLQEKDSSDTVYNTEPLPVVVKTKAPLKILMVNEFPSFETKYLKNFLSEEGHRVIAKTKLTKQKYKFEYFNTESQPIYSLNSDNLASFDLVIFDDLSLNMLSNSERTVLTEAIQQNGLGVFVQQTENRFQSKNNLGAFEIQPDTENTLKVGVVAEPLLEKYPVSFPATGLMEMAIGNYGNSKRLGLGQIGTTSLKNTYELLLDGKQAEYKEIWTSLINGLRKQTQNMGAFRSEYNWAFVNEPYDFSFFTSEENPAVVLDNHYRVPLLKNTIVADEWQGTVYPKEKGWHELVSDLDTTVSKNFYVMEEGNWSSLTSQNTLKRNKRFFDTSFTDYKEKYLPYRIPPIWFFLIFLSAMAYLWLVPKLR
ncbi:hypothetical protein DZC72_08115 [Maribacter algicola]|uniref:Uncharacterized protein n=1 Tax=Maribacter algicola TaxID=2498892 RepID=A0A426RND8_9FLAO|nr:hypothetical protein [Maribacter algicola]RRQ50496.1 hypothetical protein DZC72_08115 [Maribacter algicola]